MSLKISETPACTLPKADQRYLLDLARTSIRHGLRNRRPASPNLGALPRHLTVERATFVTLEKHGRLRGCVGSLEAARPLVTDIAVNAYAAAFRDPRFPPVEEDEFGALDIHLSLLTPPEPLNFSSEEDLLAQLRPGEDGLILEEEIRRGTFLPAVWDTLPEPREFLRHLKQKAGFSADYWSPRLRVARYRAEVITD